MIRHLWMNDTLYHAIKAKRLHHQLVPMLIQYEYGFDAEILKRLETKGHKTIPVKVQRGFSAVTGISKAHKILEASPDVRRNGSIAVF